MQTPTYERVMTMTTATTISDKPSEPFVWNSEYEVYLSAHRHYRYFYTRQIWIKPILYSKMTIGINKYGTLFFVCHVHGHLWRRLAPSHHPFFLFFIWKIYKTDDVCGVVMFSSRNRNKIKYIYIFIKCKLSLTVHIFFWLVNCHVPTDLKMINELSSRPLN